LKFSACAGPCWRGIFDPGGSIVRVLLHSLDSGRTCGKRVDRRTVVDADD